jgi:lipoprotein-anchoring transpeptidase ErfK/SrfK
MVQFLTADKGLLTIRGQTPAGGTCGAQSWNEVDRASVRTRCALVSVPTAQKSKKISGVSIMFGQLSTSRRCLAALVGLGAALASASQASAQSVFWDWGGSQTVGGAGKQTVKFPTSYRPGELVVSFGDRRLYHVTGTGVASAYPIAIPREQSRWQGVTSVSSKRENPSWTPTPTMRAENPRLPTWVPGGHPMNPLGVRALYLGSSTYRIHGTDAPWTIGAAVSKGCVRMYNQDVLDLYPRINVGTRVTVTWQKYPTGVAMAATEADVSAASAKPKKFLRPVSQRARSGGAASAGE